MHNRKEVRLANHLFVRHGFSPTVAARITGIPRSTLRDWHAGRTPGKQRQHRPRHVTPCDIDLGRFDPSAYCYLLGIYLGDGCISTYRGMHRLRVTLDLRYPGIIEDCAIAMHAIAQQRRPPCIYERLHSRCVEVGVYWRHWPCVFPQHGPGRKHLRPIVLNEQQSCLVREHPKPFLRGLIHSDGTRIVAVERKGNYVRHAPRYAFSNLSVDILGLFAAACDLVGVQYTRPSHKQIAVYRKASVALLDEFIGPKM